MKTNPRLPLLLPLACAAACLPAWCADDDERGAANADSAAIEEEVVVSASRIGAVDQRVAVFDGDTVRRAGLHAADLLATLPGVALSASGPRGALTDARVRGAEANHLLVLIDGVPANDPAAGGAFDFGMLDATGVQRIEYLPGAQSAVWGSDALAGVLHIDTAPKRSGRRVSTALGSAATRDAEAAFAAVGARGHASLALGRHRTRGANAALRGGERDGFRHDTAQLGFGGTAGAWQATAGIRATDARAEYDPTPAPLYVPVDGDRHSDTGFSLWHATVRHRHAGRFSPWLAVAGTRTRRDHFADGAFASATVGERLLATLGSGFEEGRQRASVALEFEAESFAQRAPRSDFGDPNQRQRIATRSIAAEYQIDLAAMQIAASARFDANDAFGDAVAYRLGATGAMGSTDRAALRWFASIGRGVKNPTFIERFGYLPGSFIGNPALRPEASLAVEAGIEAGFGGGAVALTLFDAALRDEIDGVFFDPDAGGFTARNLIADSRRRGTELTARAAIGPLNLRGSYVYLDAADGAGGREIRRPRHSANLHMRARLSARASAGFGVSHAGASLDRDFSTYPARHAMLAAHTLCRADLEFAATPRTTLRVQVDNLFDAGYSTIHGYRGPGRAVLAGADFSW